MAVDVTTPSDREITVKRVFDAPARRIFDAHTKPEILKRWLLGPSGWSMPTCEVDLRVGGAYHFAWRSDADGAQFGVRGKYLEIVAPTLIKHSERMEGVPGAEGESIITWTLAESGGRTTLSTTMLFPSKEARDGALKSGMTDGMSKSYDRLEEVTKEKVA